MIKAAFHNQQREVLAREPGPFNLSEEGASLLSICELCGQLTNACTELCPACHVWK